MSTKYRSETTYDGYHLSVIKSGLQKYIRRGTVDKALKCVAELDRFADMERGEGIRTNMMHRLQIIFLEDIGHGNPRLLPYMRQWIKELNEERKSSTRNRAREREVLELIVRNLCDRKKTRTCSHMNSICQLNHDNINAAIEAIPDLAPIRETYEKVMALEPNQCLDALDEALTEPVDAMVAILYMNRYMRDAMKTHQWKDMKQLEQRLAAKIGEQHIQGIWEWKPDLLKLREGVMIYTCIHSAPTCSVEMEHNTRGRNCNWIWKAPYIQKDGHHRTLSSTTSLSLINMYRGEWRNIHRLPILQKKVRKYPTKLSLPRQYSKHCLCGSKHAPLYKYMHIPCIYEKKPNIRNKPTLFYPLSLISLCHSFLVIYNTHTNLLSAQTKIDDRGDSTAQIDAWLRQYPIFS